MADAAKRRRVERDVITIDDDAPNDRPTVKIGAEPVPSPEVVQLRQKVAELERANAKFEKDFQGACRIAGEAQARVKFLEKLVDSKPEVADDANSKDRKDDLQPNVTIQRDEELLRLRSEKEPLEKRVAELSMQLDKRVDQDGLESKVNEQIMLLGEEERRLHSEQVTQLKKQLEEERITHRAEKIDLQLSLNDLKKELEEEQSNHRAEKQALEQSLNELQKQLDEERVGRAGESARLAEVTSQLASARTAIEDGNSKIIELQRENDENQHEMAEMNRIALETAQMFESLL